MEKMEKLRNIDKELAAGYKEGRKLVRDKIHQGSRDEWQVSSVQSLTREGFVVAAANKMIEESRELRRALRAGVVELLDPKNVKRCMSQDTELKIWEEMADLETLMEEICSTLNISRAAIEGTKIKKRDAVGGFHYKHFLSSTRRKKNE